MLTKFSYSVLTGSLLLITCPSMLRYSYPFLNASVSNEGRIGRFRKFGHKIGCRGNVPWAITKSFFSIWQNRKRCEELTDHLQTCSLGSRLWCVTWIGCLHKCTVGCQCSPTGTDWLHSAQCQSRNGWEDTSHIWEGRKMNECSWKTSHSFTSPENLVKIDPVVYVIMGWDWQWLAKFEVFPLPNFLGVGRK